MKRMHCIWTLCLICIWMLLGGCGGGGNAGSVGPLPQSNPLPSVTSVTPNSVTAGAPDTTVTVSGNGFISSSIVNLNGQALKTAFISATQLTAMIPAGNLAVGAINNMTVTNPPPGGGVSGGSVAFMVTNPSP